ncbi:ribosomal protein S10 [Trichoderma longibrachiatum]|uniref:Small ribosomal subunit protein uS10m n=1 Tax=Trichoderma longibrachiatum ATCC 18648 TaxID=983965 RepID=A0A2T4BQ31_TRILO|nr:ribosomal protein S10 [Trichoderma longibrachiatum ATCC 18648]
MFKQSPQRLSQLQAAVPWAARKTPALGCMINESRSRNYSAPARSDRDKTSSIRSPRSLQALHLKPLKREAEYGIPSCDLQLRSFSLQPLQFFSDFALRAAYYLGLPASGPVTLPRITERWTVPRSHFIFKKSQENFERVTLRRLIQIKDGNPETVQLWLAYLRKHQFYGIGMKANMWEFGTTETSKSLDEIEALTSGQDAPWSHLGQTRSIGAADKVVDILNSRRVKKAADNNFPIHEIS